MSIWPPTRIRSATCLVPRYVLAVCLLLLCGGVCWFHAARYAEEPSYQGKRLGQWLDAASGRHPHWRPGKEATDHAVLMMGTNAVPHLLSRLSSAGPDPPSKFTRKIAAWLWRRGFKAHALRFYDPYGQERLYAILGAWVALRPVADEIVPMLIARCKEETPFNHTAFIALGLLGPAAKTAIPFLLDETHSTRVEARAAAVSALGHLRSDAELVVPRLIACLGDPDSGVRGRAASALAQFEEELNMRGSALHSSDQQVPLALRGTSKSPNRRVEPDAVEHAVQHLAGDRTKRGAERHTRDQVSPDSVSDEVREAGAYGHGIPELESSMAYQYVAVRRMLAEATYCAERLQLRTSLPLQPYHIRRVYVAPPRILNSLGSFDTDHYSFGFGQSGRLRFITRVKPFGEQSVVTRQEELALVRSRLEPDEAYALATNWLATLCVDVISLEMNHQPAVQQRYFYGTGMQKIALPLYDVAWGSPARPAIIITIHSATGELLQLRQNDESYSRRLPGLVKGVERLLVITDYEFRNYTPAQRSTLVLDAVVGAPSADPVAEALCPQVTAPKDVSFQHP